MLNPPTPTRAHGDWLVLSPTGHLDIATGPRLAVQVSELVRSGAQAICLDLGAVDFIDSSGLAALINVQRSVDRVDGRLALVAETTGRLAAGLRSLGTPAALHLAPSVEAAVGD